MAASDTAGLCHKLPGEHCQTGTQMHWRQCIRVRGSQAPKIWESGETERTMKHTAWNSHRNAVQIWALLAVIHGYSSCGEDFELRQPACMVLSKLKAKIQLRDTKRNQLGSNLQGGPQVIYVDVTTAGGLQAQYYTVGQDGSLDVLLTARASDNFVWYASVRDVDGSCTGTSSLLIETFSISMSTMYVPFMKLPDRWESSNVRLSSPGLPITMLSLVRNSI
eukprot:768590-Hanusia_phi.AAC.2